MIGEGFDDPAFAGGAAGTGDDHARKFLFERAELFDAPTHGVEIASRDAVGVGARAFGMVGKIQERAYVRQFEAEHAGVADKVEPAHVLVGIDPPPALSARRRRNQPLLFVEADGRDL